MSTEFWYQLFLAVSGNIGGKGPVVDGVLSSHEQEFNPTTSLDENCIEFQFQTDRATKFVWDRRIWLWNWNLSTAVVTKLTISKKNKKKRIRRSKSGWGNGAGARGSSFSRYSWKMYFALNFSNVEIYINDQQNYNSNGMYARKSYFFNIFTEVTKGYKRVLQYEVYD